MDEDQTCFYNQNFLMNKPLNEETIMEYFSISQFYDKTSVNEILRMQSQFANIDISEHLTKTVGIHFILLEQYQDLYIIGKREFDGSKIRVLKLYYCMFGHIYVAPTARSISESRLIDGFWHLDQALDAYEERKKFNWLTGFEYAKEDENVDENPTESKFIMDILNEFELERQKKST